MTLNNNYLIFTFKMVHKKQLITGLILHLIPTTYLIVFKIEYCTDIFRLNICNIF